MVVVGVTMVVVVVVVVGRVVVVVVVEPVAGAFGSKKCSRFEWAVVLASTLL